jgi:hypothetical protein
VAVSWVEIGLNEADEDCASKCFVPGVFECWHGLSLMFQRGLSLYYSRFFSSMSLRFAPFELSKSFGKSTPAL